MISGLAPETQTLASQGGELLCPGCRELASECWTMVVPPCGPVKSFIWTPLFGVGLLINCLGCLMAPSSLKSVRQKRASNVVNIQKEPTNKLSQG